MKWYGFYNSLKKKTIINKKKSFKQKQNNVNFLISKKINTNLNIFNFYIPSNWNFLILKKNNNNSFLYLYFYSSTYFFILPFSKKFLSLKYDKQVNFLIFKFFFYNNFYSIFWNIFKNVFYSFSKIFFKKLKFKGKGYYIYKNNRNSIALQFGYSHLVYLYSFFLTVKFLTKTNILIFGVNNIDLCTKSHEFYNIKKINIFTGKGIRFAKQIIYRKTGKISSYR